MPTGAAVLAALVLGAFVGLIARLVLRGQVRLTWPETVLVGLAGAAIGGLITEWAISDDDRVIILVAVACTVILLTALSAWMGPRRKHPVGWSPAPETTAPPPPGLAFRALHATSSETVRELIACGESGTVELKSSARCSRRTGRRDPRIELLIAKAVAGFLNGAGGTLLIGVDDDGTIVGVEFDYPSVKHQNRDGFTLWLTDHLSLCLGRPATAMIHSSFVSVEDHDVCLVDVPPSPRPVFLDHPGGQKEADFYLRVGNSTRQLLADEIISYHEQRWPS
jgi:uncharacterized membrane protein YeaQ/YmgE (transglycosylase-associated protein family)